MAAALDLKPYGVNFVLRPGVNKINDIRGELIASGESMMMYGLLYDRITDPTDFIRVNGKKYTNLKYLGKGSYGITYSSTGSDGKQYAIKRIHSVGNKDSVVTLMKECIQQIIIVEHTKDMTNGPFAPILYDIGYNRRAKEAFIVSELMTNTIWNLVSSQTKDQNDEFIPKMLTHISKNLNALQTDLKFNHRDLKTDNVMYLTKPDGTTEFKFIDFGFTCLTWNGMFISGGDYFKHSPKCFRLERDIVQLITSIIWFHKAVLSPKLKKRLMDIIETKHGAQTRKLTQYMKEWTNSYSFLNRENYIIEAGQPQMVYDEMIRFGEGKPFQGRRASRKVRKPAAVVEVPAGVDICPPDKIMNPVTRRCVLRTGAIGRKLEKEMAAPAAAPEPAAPAAAPAAAAAAAAGSDGCPPGKIRNPKTRRCVKRDGAIGKKLP